MSARPLLRRRRRSLRVGLSSSLAVRAIVPALPRFADQHPALRIELLVDDKRQDLIVEGVDVALRFGAMADSSAVARRLMSTPRVIAASPAYLGRAVLAEALNPPRGGVRTA
jgi:DNA-binding transcriptional LysR family regulator